MKWPSVCQKTFFWGWKIKKKRETYLNKYKRIFYVLKLTSLNWKSCLGYKNLSVGVTKTVDATLNWIRFRSPFLHTLFFVVVDYYRNWCSISASIIFWNVMTVFEIKFSAIWEEKKWKFEILFPFYAAIYSILDENKYKTRPSAWILKNWTHHRIKQIKFL